MRHRKPFRLSLLLTASVLLLSGCPAAMAPSSPGTFRPGTGAATGAIGVNVGGAQDIKLVRELVEKGQVPRDTQFTAQGLYAEHDLPVAEAPAGKTLHLALGLGIAPALPEGKRTHWVQVGLGSGLTELKRPPQHLVVVADRSGSMNGDKIRALRSALYELVDKLTDADSLGLIMFDTEVDVLQGLSPVRDKEAIKRLIDQITDRGGTDIEAGLRRGYEMFLNHPIPAGYQRRVLLFTDARPNSGRTDADSFENQVATYAKAGIGMTVFGIGLDFGAELAETIGNQRGGNYVFLRDAADVQKVFREDFDFLMSPAAYDFDMQITPATGFTITQAYGVSDFKQEQGTYALKVKSLFFSKNRGAIVLRMEETAPGAGGTGAPVVARGTLRYVQADGTTQVNDTVEATATGDRPAGDGEYYAPTATRKAVALTNQFLGMNEALRLYKENQIPAAQAMLATVKSQLEAAKAALNASDLDMEIQLVTKLSANMGAPAGASPQPSPSGSPSPAPTASPAASPSPTPTASASAS